MARIRSVHPGLATDSRFVLLSDAAQIFYVLLLTIADDAGVFRWEPLELRMQLRPVAKGPVEPLLDELREKNFLQQFEAEGRPYGAVRNFCRFQSPKLPSRRFPLPQELFPYVGLKAGKLAAVGKPKPKNRQQKQRDDDRITHPCPSPSEAIPQPFPSIGEALPQPSPNERERERDYRERERERDWEKDKEKEREGLVERTSPLPRETEPTRPPRPSPKILKKDQEGEAEPRQPIAEVPEGWIAEAEAARDEAGLEPVNLTLEWLKFAMRTDGEVELRRWIEWSLRAWVRTEPQRHANGTSGFAAATDLPEPPWDARMRHWHKSGWWHQDFGPKPNEPGCFVPPKYLA